MKVVLPSEDSFNPANLTPNMVYTYFLKSWQKFTRTVFNQDTYHCFCHIADFLVSTQIKPDFFDFCVQNWKPIITSRFNDKENLDTFNINFFSSKGVITIFLDCYYDESKMYYYTGDIIHDQIVDLVLKGIPVREAIARCTKSKYLNKDKEEISRVLRNNKVLKQEVEYKEKLLQQQMLTKDELLHKRIEDLTAENKRLKALLSERSATPDSLERIAKHTHKVPNTKIPHSLDFKELTPKKSYLESILISPKASPIKVKGQVLDNYLDKQENLLRFKKCYNHLTQIIRL